MYKNLGLAPSASRRLALSTLTHSSLAVTGSVLLSPLGNALAQTAPPLKVGFVYVTPIADAGWTAQHNLGRLYMEQALGAQVQTRFVDKVAEGADAERVIRDLAAQGSQLIFTTSFGYMDPTLKVAKEFPRVAFEHATGYKSAPNMANYNARFYEGRYLAGMVAAKMSRSGVAGYVAAFPIPEVLQGINAFMLGMQAVNPKAQIKVIWTSSWFDPGKERDAAFALINQSADVLTHHTDSTAVVQAADEKGVFSVGYHSDMSKFAPKGHLTAVTHHWGAYYTRVARAVLAGTWKPAQPGVWGGVADGFIKLAPLHSLVPKDFAASLAEREKAIVSGKFHPFSGRLIDNEGKERQASGLMTDQLLNQMNYYLVGVQGALPKA
jgi:basic membrane protein A and related proteins